MSEDKKELNENELDKVTGGKEGGNSGISTGGVAIKIDFDCPCSCYRCSDCPEYASCTKNNKK